MRNAVRFALVAAVLSLLSLFPSKAAASTTLYGENCTNIGGAPSCGIGNDINLPTIECHILNNNDPNDKSIPARQTLAAYGTLPNTYDASQMICTFDTFHPSYGEVRGGAFGVTDTIWPDLTPGGLHHMILVDHLIPAGGASPGAFYGFYVDACQHSFPCSNADGTMSGYPGPTAVCQGCHYFKIITPPPAAKLPATWEFNYVGHIPAFKGNETFAIIPIFSIMKTGRFTSLPTTATVNNIALSSQNNQFYFWNGSGWTQTVPEWYLTTFNLKINGVTYTCHPDAQGNHNASTGDVQRTCTNGTSDVGVALAIYYAGVFGTDNQDKRFIKYDASVGQPYLDVITADAPTGNPTPQVTLEVYAGSSAITGDGTAELAFTLYRGTDHVPAAPATVYNLSVPVSIKPVQIVAADPPTQFTPDPGLLSYDRHAAQSTTNLCFNTGLPYSLRGWLGINTATWWMVGPAGYWGEDQSWLYDQGSVYHQARQHFTQMMAGGNWGDWAAAHVFGDAYATSIIKPTTNNPGNYYYMAMSSGAVGTTQPVWSSHTAVGATFTDGAQTWMVLPNQAAWEACIVYAQNPYVVAVVMNGAQSTGQFSQYGKGALESFYTTGDAFPQDGSFKVGMYSRTVIDLSCEDSGSSECQVDHAGAGLPAFQNVFSPNAGRGVSHAVESLAMRLRLEYSQGTISNFTSNAVLMRNWKLLINANINWLYFLTGQSNVGTLRSLDNLQPHADSFYLGIVQNSLIMTYNTAMFVDPNNVYGLRDERIPEAIKESIDYEVTYWFDQPFSQQGIHTYALGFTPHDLQTVQGLGGVGGTKNAFFNELEPFEVGPITWWYARNGNSSRGPGGVGYDTISDQFRLGAFAAYNCTFWDCSKFPDGQWLHPWAGSAGTPKQLGMSYKTALANDEAWRNGYRKWYELDVDPGRNPCRDGSNGSNPCAAGHHSAFADVMPAYPIQVFGSGTTRFGSYPYNQIDPTDCPVPCHFTGDKASPLSDVGANQVTVTVFTTEQPASASLGYSTDTSCNQTWATQNPGLPKNVSVNTATLWESQWTPTGLNPSTNYHFNIKTRDLAGNTFSTNCGATPGGWSGGNLNVTTLAQVGLIIATQQNLATGVINQTYSASLIAQGGVPPYTWSIVSGSLPPGLNAATGSNGQYVIQGTPSPSDSGTYQFTARVQDSQGHAVQQVFSIFIQSLAIPPQALPTGTNGVAYPRTQLVATGGQGTLSWAVKGGGVGILPPGLQLSSSGVLSGTPTAAGNFATTFQVTDQSSPQQAQSVTLPIIINASTQQPSSVIFDKSMVLSGSALIQ